MRRVRRVDALEVSTDRDSGAWSEHHGAYDDEDALIDGRWLHFRHS